MTPLYVSREQIPQAVIDKELEIYKVQAQNEGKPAQIARKDRTGSPGKILSGNSADRTKLHQGLGKTIKDIIDEETRKSR